MVKKVIKMMYKEVRGLHQAAYVLALFTFGSQLLALVRDRTLAHQFGAGVEMDLYYAAFRIPDLLYVLFASTLSVYVLIPFVSTRQRHEDGEGARNLLSQVFSIFLIIYVLLAALLILFTPVILPWLFPGLSSYSDSLITMTRILLLQPLFLGISSLFGVVTQLGHRFVLYAISPLIYNLGIIAGIIILYPLFGLSGLAYGVVLGALGHMLVQWPLVRGSALAFRFTFKLDFQMLKKIFAVSIPRAATLAMSQVVLLVFVSIASLMSVGSVAVFQFAYNLQAVPLAVIGASYSIASFPLLASLYASEQYVKFRIHIVSTLRHIMFWAIPIIGLVIVLRAQLVRVVLGSGQFNWADTKLTAAILAILVVSLCAQAINLLIIRTFYAGGYTKIPFLVTFVGSLVAIGSLYYLYIVYDPSLAVFSYLTDFMRLGSVPGSEVLILPIAYSLALLLQSIVLTIIAAYKFSIPFAWFGKHLLHATMAAVVGSMFSYTALNFFVVGINQETFIGIFIQGFLAGLAGLVGVVMAYYLLRTPELKEVVQAFRGKLFCVDVVAPQEDVI